MLFGVSLVLLIILWYRQTSPVVDIGSDARVQSIVDDLDTHCPNIDNYLNVFKIVVGIWAKSKTLSYNMVSRDNGR